jgi:hypothetical protein
MNMFTKKLISRVFPIAFLLVLILTQALPAYAEGLGINSNSIDMTVRVSVDNSGNQANGGNYKNEISDNGQVVAFQSLATNLVLDDTNGFSDIFVHDRLSGQTQRVNISSSGDQANNYVADLSMSANGQFIAFWSNATNLVSGDTNGQSDVFVHDRGTGQTERVSVDGNGNQANSYSYEFSISADGRFVSFLSFASNLVSGDTNGTTDIFVHDRQTGQTERISLDGSGNQANSFSDFSAISADGQFVVFRSAATNLVPGDTNGIADIFIHDRQTGQTQRVNVDGSGNQANAGGSNETSGNRAELAVSADGRFIAFESLATNLVSNDTNGVADIFIRDRQTGQTERVSVDNNGGQSNGVSADLSMSDDGRFVVFRSDASNLVPNDNNATSDIFLHDRQTGQTERISMDGNGIEGNNYSFWPSISADGQFISFGSFAGNLVSNDTNNTADIFVSERASSTPTPTPTQTDIPTFTPTATQTYTSTPTFTPTDTYTPLPTATAGPTSSVLISTLDNAGKVGLYTSLELNSMGSPVISYHDQTNGDLKIAICGNPACTAGNTLTTVDSSGNVGIWTSLELNSSGFPVISYNDQTNGDLKLAVCGNPTCTSGNTITIVDDIGNVGSWGSLALNSSGFPVISYIDEANSDLKLVVCGNATCTSGNTITTVDSAGYVGLFTSLKLNMNGYPVISYWDQGNYDLKVAVCGNTTCTSANTISIVDSTGDVGRYSSLALNANDYPVISYWDVTNHSLKVAVCGDVNCTSGNTLATVDNSPGEVGLYTSLLLTSGGLPIISYYDYNNGDLKLAICGDVICSSNNTLTTVDGSGYVGTYTSLELSSAGFPVISYFESANPGLKVAVCGNPTCDTSADPTLTNTPTQTPTATYTPTPPHTATSTPTETHTASPTPTYTATSTPPYTDTPTETPTFTLTPNLNLSLLAPANGEQLLYNRPTFDWTDVPDAINYTIQISNNIGFTSPTSNTVTASTYTQSTNLTANATRYWRVQANTVSGTGPWSEIRNFKTANPPSAAGLVAPANNGLVTDYTPLLDWNNSTVPVGTTFLKYELQITTDNAFTSPSIIDLAGPVTDSSYTPAAQLDPNTTYYWRVRSYNTLEHYSTWSTRSFRTALLPPALNTPNDADLLLNNRPTFDWDDVPGVTGYRIQISDVSDFTTTLVNAVVTPSTYVRTTDLPANITLYWRVHSRGTNGPSAWSDVRVLTTANPPSVPTLLSPANNAEVSGSSLVFNWEDALLPFGVAFDHYQIQVATSNTFTTIVHDQVISGIANSQDNSALLPPSTTYYWRVRSFNVDGHSSAWSVVRSVRIKFAGPALNLPANGSTAGSLSPTFTWDAVSGATDYTIQVSKNSSFSPLVINTIAGTNSYTHGTNLQTGTTYYWRVRVNTPAAYGPGDWSQVYSFTTP